MKKPVVFKHIYFIGLPLLALRQIILGTYVAISNRQQFSNVSERTLVIKSYCILHKPQNEKKILHKS